MQHAERIRESQPPFCFGTFDKELDRELAWWALGILSTVCVLALIALAHRVRAVDIVE